MYIPAVLGRAVINNFPLRKLAVSNKTSFKDSYDLRTKEGGTNFWLHLPWGKRKLWNRSIEHVSFKNLKSDQGNRSEIVVKGFKIMEWCYIGAMRKSGCWQEVSYPRKTQKRNYLYFGRRNAKYGNSGDTVMMGCNHGTMKILETLANKEVCLHGL